MHNSSRGNTELSGKGTLGKLSWIFMTVSPSPSRCCLAIGLYVFMSGSVCASLHVVTCLHCINDVYCYGGTHYCVYGVCMCVCVYASCMLDE